LRPLRLALLVEERFEARAHPIPPRDGVEHQHLTVGTVHELHRPVESVEEPRPSRKRPRRLLHRYRAHTAKFPPDRHPVPRRLRGKPIRQQQPIHTMTVAHVTSARVASATYAIQRALQMDSKLPTYVPRGRSSATSSPG